MESKKLVRVESLFPDIFFQGFWRFSYADGVGLRYPNPRMNILHNNGLRVVTSCFC